MPDIMLSEQQVQYLRRHIHARFKQVMNDLHSFGAKASERETFELLNAFGGPIRGALPVGATPTTMAEMAGTADQSEPVSEQPVAPAEAQQPLTAPPEAQGAGADLSGEGTGPQDTESETDSEPDSLDDLGA